MLYLLKSPKMLLSCSLQDIQLPCLQLKANNSIPKAKREVNLNDQKIPLNRVLSHVTFSIFLYALLRKVSESAPKSI